MAIGESNATTQLSRTAEVTNALSKAEPNVLRITLYQLTGDPELAAMRVLKQPVRGGILITDVLSAQDAEIVRAKARDYLLSRVGPTPAPPSDAETHRLMALFSGEELTKQFLVFGKEELAFDEFPRSVNWSHKPRPEVLKKFHVTVVGCGISGIAAGIQLKRLGIPFTIVERNPSVGGTWWTNNYPGCRVDTTSYLYQFKFIKNYPWPHHFATAAETLHYLEQIVAQYELLPHIRLNTEVTAARWSEPESRWHITLLEKGGRQDSVDSNFVMSAVGVFHSAKLPNIPGISDYQGAIFHTTKWDHRFDYAGKHIGLIGTGSTGSQLMPTIAKTAGSVTVFQRTAQWVMPAENYQSPVDEETRWLFDNVPYYWNWFSYSQFASAMKLQGIMVYDQQWRSKGGKINERNDTLRDGLLRYIKDKIGDLPALYDKAIPKFAPFGRRSVIDSGWYDALRRDNVKLETTPIKTFTKDGITTTDGKEYKLDLVVLAAGFHASKFLSPVDYIGRNGLTLNALWNKDGARAYLGITLPGYPNFFMMWGPNGLARNGGYYSWAEMWTRYILQGIIGVIESSKQSIEVKRQAFEQYNASLDEEMKNLLWGEEAKGSYYQNEFGRMDLGAPWVVEDFHAMLVKPNLNDFDIK